MRGSISRLEEHPGRGKTNEGFKVRKYKGSKHRSATEKRTDCDATDEERIWQLDAQKLKSSPLAARRASHFRRVEQPHPDLRTLPLLSFHWRALSLLEGHKIKFDSKPLWLSSFVGAAMAEKIISR